MSGDSTIADVSSTLLKLLRDKLSDLVPQNSIVLQSPADISGQNTRLSLFLFNALENPYLKNQESGSIGMGQLQDPPLVLDLHYMLTSYSYVPDFTERTLEEQRILGRAMRVLYDHPIISESILQGGLANSNEKLRITLNPASVTELSEIWRMFPNQNFKPSVTYTVSPTSLQSQRVTEPKRVTIRDLNYANVGKIQR